MADTRQSADERAAARASRKAQLDAIKKGMGLSGGEGGESGDVGQAHAHSDGANPRHYEARTGDATEMAPSLPTTNPDDADDDGTNDDGSPPPSPPASESDAFGEAPPPPPDCDIPDDSDGSDIDIDNFIETDDAGEFVDAAHAPTTNISSPVPVENMDVLQPCPKTQAEVDAEKDSSVVKVDLREADAERIDSQVQVEGDRAAAATVQVDVRAHEGGINPGVAPAAPDEDTVTIEQVTERRAPGEAETLSEASAEPSVERRAADERSKVAKEVAEKAPLEQHASEVGGSYSKNDEVDAEFESVQAAVREAAESARALQQSPAATSASHPAPANSTCAAINSEHWSFVAAVDENRWKSLETRYLGRLELEGRVAQVASNDNNSAWEHLESCAVERHTAQV